MKKAVDETQLRQFIAHVDLLTERLTPKRRPQDRNAPECSQQELKALAALGHQEVLTMSDIAAILNVPLSTATHTIDNLVEKGVVERKRVEQDRRVVQITFSKKGKRINQFVLESRLAAGREMLKAIKPKEREAFLQSLQAMVGTAASSE